uniref:Uncharacterized protein n=1 Tax=Panstrongylus lignarius TaxID=156445 RepID=A0A224Y1R3_9HEMI
MTFYVFSNLFFISLRAERNGHLNFIRIGQCFVFLIIFCRVSEQYGILNYMSIDDDSVYFIWPGWRLETFIYRYEKCKLSSLCEHLLLFIHVHPFSK